MSDQTIYRSCNTLPVELSRKKTDEPPRIVGYAAVFYRSDDPRTEFEMLPGFRERIAPEAFNRALAEGQDVRGLFNHDPNQVLGRMPKTMRLKTDKTGLAYEIDLPDTNLGRDLASLIERGDVRGSSFSFRVVGRSLQDLPDGGTIRTLEDVDLLDVGPVTFPAYEATTADMRAAYGKALEAARTLRGWQSTETPGGLAERVRRRLEALAREMALDSR
jgi:HK97 family phage prohead protease